MTRPYKRGPERGENSAELAWLQLMARHINELLAAYWALRQSLAAVETASAVITPEIPTAASGPLLRFKCTPVRRTKVVGSHPGK